MTDRSWKQSVLAVPGVGISLLPKLMCPACWPAYASLLSSLGLGFLISTKYLLPLTALLLALCVGSLAFRASTRRGLGPFGVGLMGAVGVLSGKFYFNSATAGYIGVILLILASIWNIWPHRAAAVSCPACLLTEDAHTQEEGRQGETQP